MRDFEFDHNTLFKFSNSDPYQVVRLDNANLFESLNQIKKKYNFPAVHNDVGALLSFICQLQKPEILFEMGSGYGHSAFWYLNSNIKTIEKIYLTERREDLADEFNQLAWPSSFKKKIDYYQGDAFVKLASVSSVDFVLVDGQKSDYLRFLNELYPKLNKGGIIFIDNSYWRGSFLDQESVENKKSARNIKELHDYIAGSNQYEKIFLPFIDGVSILLKI